MSQLGILREYGPLVEPRLVLWFVTDNDLKGLRDEMKSPILMRYLDAGFSQGLVREAFWVNKLVQGEAGRIIVWAKDRYPGIRLWRWIEGMRRAGQERSAAKLDVQKLSETFKTILGLAQRATPGKVILVYLADYRKGGVSYRDVFLALWNSIDTTLPNGDAEMLHQWGIGHYTPLGNELAAHSILREFGHAVAAR